ncbi:MAG: hypothetical protein J6M02_07135 [Clostridia bacterium]|nr:hypothetical protein [Clostridia bacterium]
MKMSKLAIRTSKVRGQEEALSQEILFQSSLLKRHSAGIYSMGPLLVKSRNKLIELLREKLSDADCVEISLSSLQPARLWQESGRWNVYKDSRQMFTLQDRNDTWYCLGPTHEEMVVDFLRNILVSYRDLPVNVFQISMKYRDEIRTHGGLLRSKEFMMADGYSFHTSFEDMAEEYLKMRKAYSEFFATLGLATVPVKAVNAEMGGRVSEEFMVICDIGEDKLLYDEATGLGWNMEVLEIPQERDALRKRYPDLCFETLRRRSCIEVGHIFQLGTYYSQGMNACFIDRDGKKKPYFMGCYGIGINRTLATCLEMNCDEKGLVWPEKIAPYSAVMVYAEEKRAEAFACYEALRKRGAEVLLDDRAMRFGEKLKDAKLLGVPYLVILGKKAPEGTMEVEKRVNGEKCFLSFEKLADLLKP